MAALAYPVCRLGRGNLRAKMGYNCNFFTFKKYFKAKVALWSTSIEARGCASRIGCYKPNNLGISPAIEIFPKKNFHRQYLFCF